MAAENDKLCPKVEPLNSNVKRLSYDERLQAIQTEAQTLYEYCLAKGFKDHELSVCMTRLRGDPQIGARKVIRESSHSLLGVAILVGIVAAFYGNTHLNNMLVVHLKLIEIKAVLPFYDWTWIYNEDCLILNSYLPEESPRNYTEQSCSYCLELKNETLERFANVEVENITKDFLLAGIPFIVTDVWKDWIDKKTLSMDEIVLLYRSDEALKFSMGSCNYTTNFGFNTTFYSFIDAYVDKLLPEQWAAHWENCDAKGAKVIRRYYPRPYFIPAMAQADSKNMLIAAFGVQNATWSSIPSSESGNSALWLTVVEGSLNVRLIPEAGCTQLGCFEVRARIEKGETVTYTLRPDWKGEYQPTSDGLTLALGSTVIWDEKSALGADW